MLTMLPKIVICEILQFLPLRELREVIRVMKTLGCIQRIKDICKKFRKTKMLELDNALGIYFSTICDKCGTECTKIIPYFHKYFAVCDECQNTFLTNVFELQEQDNERRRKQKRQRQS